MAYQGMAGGASLHNHRLNMAYMPTPKYEYVINFTNLTGGLNVFETPINLQTNESPDIGNLRWSNGILQSRLGQRWLIENQPDYGRGHTAYSEPFWHHGFLHIGTGLYCFEFDTLTPTLTQLASGLTEARGTFFTYHGSLYYKNRGSYLQIHYNAAGATPTAMFPITDVAATAYTPVTYINASPTNGAGDSYQPENRLSASKTIWYDVSASTTDFYLPVQDVDSIDTVIVDGVTLVAGTDYTAYPALGKVELNSPALPHTPFEGNTVRITYTKANPDAYNAIMDCPYAIVYGGDTNLCVVMGGCKAQPNAYFWNGNNVAMDASYFPMEHYNLAGDTEDAVTGFGKQQNMLVIFSAHSVGRASLSTTTLNTGNPNERVYIQLPYVNINSMIGCDLPWSIQLIENNLVFCNTDQGVHMVYDSSAAYENNIFCISKKVNGNPARPYLLHDVRRKTKVTSYVGDGVTVEYSLGDTTLSGAYKVDSVTVDGVVTEDWTADLDAGTVTFVTAPAYKTFIRFVYQTEETQNACSFDTGTEYWLCANGHVYVWNYEVSTYKKPSWFYYTNFKAKAFFRNEGDYYHLDTDGKLTALALTYSDYDEPIPKWYEFPTQNMGSYDRLKDVSRAIFVTQPSANTRIDIQYITDWERRKDLTPIIAYSWRLVPRDLSFRYLGVGNLATTAIRRPGCRHIRHFTVRLTNDILGQDMSILSAQVFYKFQGRDR